MTKRNERGLLIYGIMLLIVFSLFAPLAIQGEDSSRGQIKIVATFFPVYLFTKNITAGIDDIKVDILLPPQYGCPHDFALAPEDLKKINKADIIVLNGLGLEAFLTEAIATGKPNTRVIDASESVTPLRSKYSENHGHTALKDSVEYNPHAFTSPREAALMVDRITSRLAEILPAYRSQLEINGQQYRERLDRLSSAYKDSLQNLANNRIVTVHEVFDYMARDYGLEIAEIIEKEPGQEPSAREMLSLAKDIKEKNVAALFSEPQYSARVVETLGKELNLPFLQLDPVASGPANPPDDYYERVMYNNLNILLKCLRAK
jgi:zinc transport system substrate-binding protein